MPETTYRGRRACAIENAAVRVTVLCEGGHIAEILDKSTGVNPLWTPPWPTIEPSRWTPGDPTWGNDAESRLLSGIMGHNLCLDVFGGPSPEEYAAGVGVHGEGSVAEYQLDGGGESMTARADLPLAGLRFTRTLRLDGRTVRIREEVENLGATDRPIAWTQHVTMGPPFVAPGATQFRVPATRSKVFESDFTGGKGYMATGVEFDWPHVPRIGGGSVDLRTYVDLPVSGGYTAHLLDPAREDAFFTAWSPEHKVAFGYVWRRADFPWIGIWEENHCREFAPWNGETVTRGMEFGVSPMPETRRAMIDRGGMFGVPGYRWIPARTKAAVEYAASVAPSDGVPEEMTWRGF